MTLKEFKDEVLSHYIDKDFQVTVDRDPTPQSSGNGLFHTAIFYSVLALNNSITALDLLNFRKCVDLCWVGTLDKPILGLLERNDGRPDKEAQDDYHIATASYLLGTYHAQAIFHFGLLHNFCFNNQKPTEEFSVFAFNSYKSWHGRFLGQVPYYSICAGASLDCVSETALKLLIWLGPPGHSDRAAQQWLKVQAIKKYGILQDSVKEWEVKALKRFGSLGGMLEPYFGSSHPMSRIPNLGLFDG